MDSENEAVSLPRATITKMIKDFLPPEMRAANDTVDLLIECCTEFIQLLSSEANEVAEREKKNTIHPEHVLLALKELGFDDMMGEVNGAWETYKQDAKTTVSQKANLKKTMADQQGLTEEQQIALQQQMFAAARARSLTSAEQAAAAAAAYNQQLAAHGVVGYGNSSSSGLGSPQGSAP